MKINRRFFLKSGIATLAGTCLAAQSVRADNTENTDKNNGKENQNLESAQVACLVDTTLCIGCRKCEEACNARNNLPRPETPFTDPYVMRQKRRPTPEAYTVVNQYPGSPSPDQNFIKMTHSKVQCMHCLTPACVSACLVGAMKKSTDGSVTYDKSICIGCRYCMVACPFEIPAYEYADPLTPRVRKCQFCSDMNQNKGANPSCAQACPTEALVFGKRKDLLALAKDRIKIRPDRYIDYIYGEKEVGGTSWLYLVGRPPDQLGLLKMPEQSPAELTESIQHGIFKYGIIPVAVYGILSGIMWKNKKKNNSLEDKNKDSKSNELKDNTIDINRSNTPNHNQNDDKGGSK